MPSTGPEAVTTCQPTLSSGGASELDTASLRKAVSTEPAQLAMSAVNWSWPGTTGRRTETGSAGSSPMLWAMVIPATDSSETGIPVTPPGAPLLVTVPEPEGGAGFATGAAVQAPRTTMAATGVAHHWARRESLLAKRPLMRAIPSLECPTRSA